jgi:hypothetical protein
LAAGVDAFVRLLAVGGEWASYASLVPGRGGARAAASEASEQLAKQAVRNPIPKRAARVISVDPELAQQIARSKSIPFPSLGRPNSADVFITAASDIHRIKTARGLAKRLTLLDEAGNFDVRPKLVLEFDTPLVGIGTPVFRNNPGFVGGGRTAGGAREFVIPNLPLSQLRNLTWRIVW